MRLSARMWLSIAVAVAAFMAGANLPLSFVLCVFTFAILCDLGAINECVESMEKKIDTLTKLLDTEKLVPDTKPEPKELGPD